MAVIRWSFRAAVDLENICEYIATDSEQEYNLTELRERIFQNCRIVYRVGTNEDLPPQFRPTAIPLTPARGGRLR